MREFDITQHEFRSGDFVDAFPSNFSNEPALHFFIAPYCHGRTWIDKQDAIAIAKHFNLTAEDL